VAEEHELNLEAFANFEALRKEHRRLIRKHNDFVNSRIDLEKVIADTARASFSALKPPRPAQPTTDRRTKGEEVAIVTCADWQLGRITPDYNIEIAEQRIKQYAEKIRTITDIHRADHPVKKAHVWLLGDIVDGEQIFPGHPYELDSSLVDQVVTNGSRILRNFLYELLSYFQEVRVIGVVGNHGRIGRVGAFHPDTNADRMLYLVTREYFKAAGEKRIAWEIPRAHKGDRGWYHVDLVGNYRSLLVHGDQFRGGNSYAGLPFFSFSKKALFWRDMGVLGDMDPFQDIWCGHWHRVARVPVGSMVVRVCGTPMSTDPWSIETLSASARPAQVLAYCEPHDGRITAEYEVNLD
jgi:hypothetical protein